MMRVDANLNEFQMASKKKKKRKKKDKQSPRQQPNDFQIKQINKILTKN